MSDHDGIEVEVSAEVATLTRANVLGHVARGLLSAIGASKSVLDTALGGFREMLLQKVQMVMRSATKEVLGYLCIEVDWDRYAVTLERGTGKATFQLDPKVAVTGQVAPLLENCTAYLAEITKGLEIAEWEVIYTSRPGKLQAFHEKFHTRSLTEQEQQNLNQVVLNKELKVTDHNLPEMSVLFRHKS